MDLIGRVFAAATVPLEIQKAVTEQLREVAIPGRKVPTGNFHITLRFLDVISEVTYERFLSAMESVQESPAFKVALSGLGAFPRSSKATVLWAGVGAGALELARLNEIAEEAAQMVGLPPEERPFHPHLTISRIRPPVNVKDLLDHDLDVRWRCGSVTVYRSHLGREGTRYEPLETLVFSR